MKLRIAKLFGRAKKSDFEILSDIVPGDAVQALLPAKTELRELLPFRRISVGGMVDLEFTQAKEQYVELTLAHNVTSMLRVEVVDDGLQVSVDGDFFSSRRPRIVCSAPSIDSLKRSGCGSLICCNLSSEHLTVEHMGTGRISLIGNVGNLFATIKGKGHVDCSNLDNNNLKLSLVGCGVFEGSAKHAVDCYLQGGGSINVMNQPKVVNAVQRGAGSIRVNGVPAG